ncbi:la-related protein 6 [Alligator mississippiensis]|uniref:la-related protein 6 n=1 Tax=Alligator mississippiensis TaxID=8496 RepID=UPI002877BE3A|nr:la-related protein 6 [Alligator mississippiensis]
MAAPRPGGAVAEEPEAGSPAPGRQEAVGAGAEQAGAGPVRIRVAIEAAEEEEEQEEEGDGAALALALAPTPGSLGGGSCSEDDSGRHGKSSGGENDEDFDQDWKPPENDLIQKLIEQIEYYFSDENLEKDAFLLKHVRRNKMGYVSVKLLTSFKKVKHLTRDWRTTAHALKYSSILELNEDNKKVRRNTPVPVFPSENLPTRMLLVYDMHLISELPALNKEQENGCMQEKIMEHLLKAFVIFGVISSVRILKPGRDLPPDIKRFSSRYTQVGTQECAIVEFEEVDAAIKAHESMSIEKNEEAGMKVVLIGMKPPKKKVLKDKNRDDDPSKGLNKIKSLNKRVEELQYVGDESSANSSSDPESNPASPLSGRKSDAMSKLSPPMYQNNHLSPNVSPRSSPWNSPSLLRKVSRKSPLAEEGKLNPTTSPEIPRKYADYSSDSSITPSSSPWVQRRRLAQTATQEKSPVGSPMLARKIQNAGGLPVGVLRLPKGPDGTKGFHNGCERNKPKKNE